MYNFLVRVLILFGVVCCCSANAQEKRADPYLGAKDGGPALTHDLVLRVEQDGTGGMNIRTWALGKDGSWSIQDSFVSHRGRAESAPKETGTLSERRVLEVGDVLRSNELLKLPDTLGTKSKVNPNVYTLTFDKKKVTLHGVPSYQKGSLQDHMTAFLPRDKDSAKEATRFARIAQAVVDSCKDK